ncbi:MAG: hypothetical protein UDG86_03565 [Lachnospiraceae bacterium]|jgi:hypothetical protein|nr:hypothetical protein [Lachnospiraceae bacterium]
MKRGKKLVMLCLALALTAGQTTLAQGMSAGNDVVKSAQSEAPQNQEGKSSMSAEAQGAGKQADQTENEGASEGEAQKPQDEQSKETETSGSESPGTNTPKEPETGDDNQGQEYQGPYLEIDNSHVYDGMDKSFQEGYLPAVRKNKASLTVPFTELAAVQGGKVQAEIDLGDASSAPFVFKNYNTTLEKKSYRLKEGSIQAYLLKLELELKKDRQPGSYPVVVTLKGKGENGQAFSQVHTFYITVQAGSDRNPGGGQGTAEPGGGQDLGGYGGGEGTQETEIKPQPKVILQNVNMGNSILSAGEETGIEVVFLNTNKSSFIQNITVAVSAEGNSMLFEKKSFYIDKVAAGNTFSVKLKVTVMKDTLITTDKLQFTIEYEDPKATAITETEDFILKITQPVVLETENLDIPAKVYAAETIPVSMKVMNMSRVKIYNVRFSMEAPGLMPKESAFIGNMEAGSAAVGTMSVYIGTKDLVEADGDVDTDGSGVKYGTTQGKITLTYEDEFGEVYTEEQEFTTNINKPEILSPVVPKEEQAAGQWWISILAAFGGMAAVLGAAALRRFVLRKADTYGK